jgi:hypothetical protein
MTYFSLISSNPIWIKFCHRQCLLNNKKKKKKITTQSIMLVKHVYHVHLNFSKIKYCVPYKTQILYVIVSNEETHNDI